MVTRALNLAKKKEGSCCHGGDFISRGGPWGKGGGGLIRGVGFTKATVRNRGIKRGKEGDFRERGEGRRGKRSFRRKGL